MIHMLAPRLAYMEAAKATHAHSERNAWKNQRKIDDTHAGSKTSIYAKATHAHSERSGQDANLQAIAVLRTELITKVETQLAEIRSQVDQLRAELKLANDNVTARSEVPDRWEVTLESAANSHSDSNGT